MNCHPKSRYFTPPCNLKIFYNKTIKVLNLLYNNISIYKKYNCHEYNTVYIYIYVSKMNKRGLRCDTPPNV